jgi:hypothetical protein
VAGDVEPVKMILLLIGLIPLLFAGIVALAHRPEWSWDLVDLLFLLFRD